MFQGSFKKVKCAKIIVLSYNKDGTKMTNQKVKPMLEENVLYVYLQLMKLLIWNKDFFLCSKLHQ